MNLQNKLAAAIAATNPDAATAAAVADPATAAAAAAAATAHASTATNETCLKTSFFYIVY